MNERYEPDRPSEQNARRWPVRLILFAVVFALVIPGLLFCGVLLQQIATAERTRSREAVQASALRTADALDRELSNITAALVVLGTSPALHTDDLAAFSIQARAASAIIRHDIVLADPAGQQVASSMLPHGPYPMMGSLDTVRRVVETREPAVSNLFTGATRQAASLAIEVPVFRGDRVAYVLAANIQPASLYAFLRQQQLPNGWRAGVTDGDARLIARNTDDERFTGTVANDQFRSLAAEDSAVWIGRNLEDVPVLAAMQRQRLANWRVSVALPLSMVEAQLRRTIALLAVGGSIALGIAGLLAWTLADSIAVPLRRLARAGEAAAGGLPVPGVRSNIAEVHAVSRALVQATKDLRSRADALAAERAQLAAVIETVPVGLVIAEAPSGRVVAGNSQLERMLRHPLRLSASTAAYGEWVATHPDGRPVEASEFPMARVLRGEPHSDLQCLYRRGDGTTLWVQIVAAPILAADGTLTGGVAAMLDIDEAVRARDEKARFAERLEAQVAERTAALQDANQRLRDEMAARSAAEEQLRQAQKMEAVGQLTGGIAHDFNNLLTIVVGSLDLLRRRTDDARTRRLADNALEGASRAAALIARLLAFSRRQPLSPRALDAGQLVAGMADLLHHTLGEAVTIETRLPPALWLTHADPNQLESALLNLAVNARDAMTPAGPNGLGGPRGTLLIEAGNIVLGPAAAMPDLPPGDYVSLAVSDTGSGMTDAVAARVFEPFFTTKQPGQGTGLGLSQVHGFVKQSGGHIALRTAPGAGTTVTIMLPRFQGAAARAEPAARPVVQTPSLLILLVEDEAAVRRYSAEALRELGHTVIEAGDGPEALRQLDANPRIGLLFTDVVLPRMDGAQLADAVRARRPDLPVLFASGYTGDRELGDDLLGPGALLLRKPFTLVELAGKLQEAVRLAGLEPATKPL